MAIDNNLNELAIEYKKGNEVNIGIMLYETKMYACKLYNKYYRNLRLYIEEEEGLEGVIYNSFVKTISVYSIEKNTKFTTLFSSIFKNELLQIKRKCSSRINYANLSHNLDSLDREVTDDEKVDLHSRIRSNDCDYNYVELKIEVQYYLDRLKDRDKLIINRYLQGYSMREIGREVNISQSRVSRIVKEFKVYMESIIEERC